MESKSGHEQKKVRTSYGLIFILLAVFTAVEVGASYLPASFKIPILLLMAVIKASLVVLYFMHLKSDARLYAMFFAVGFVLIIPIVLILTVVMPSVR